MISSCYKQNFTIAFYNVKSFPSFLKFWLISAANVFPAKLIRSLSIYRELGAIKNHKHSNKIKLYIFFRYLVMHQRWNISSQILLDGLIIFDFIFGSYTIIKAPDFDFHFFLIVCVWFFSLCLTIWTKISNKWKLIFWTAYMFASPFLTVALKSLKNIFEAIQKDRVTTNVKKYRQRCFCYFRRIFKLMFVIKLDHKKRRKKRNNYLIKIGCIKYKLVAYFHWSVIRM